MVVAAESGSAGTRALQEVSADGVNPKLAAWFKITDDVLDSLSREGMPKEILSKVTFLKDKEFATRDNLSTGLQGILPKGDLERWREPVLNHAKSNGLPDAEIHRAAGVYYLRSGRSECVNDAVKHFGLARTLLMQSPASTERSALLIDLALAQVDLAGNDADVEKKVRLSWAATQDHLRMTLEHLMGQYPAGEGRPTEAFVTGLRVVARKMIARGAAQHTDTLARQFNEPESLAVVGLEAFRSGEKTLATSLANKALENYLSTDKLAAPKNAAPVAREYLPSVSLAVLCKRLQLKLPGDKPTKEQEEEIKLALALETPAGKTDLDTALDLMEKGTPVSPWVLWRLLPATMPAETGQRVLRVAAKITDAGLRGRIQLAVLQAQLGQMDGQADDSVLKSVDEQCQAQALACEALARHNEGHGHSAAKTVDSWQAFFRPFGYMGAALGLQDAKH